MEEEEEKMEEEEEKMEEEKEKEEDRWRRRTRRKRIMIRKYLVFSVFLMLRAVDQAYVIHKTSEEGKGRHTMA
ncbi:hypothetical protein PoB_003513800 [Plakobranchus ocellatus]|uniref:Uncharacterized protein n=1 Tax=Plakobranchus ocellatus TaxID=259542 RepID=A0AAV4AMW0_9GAST|nr:hypothetical protein PoB_003513800 [Plakobranchus ocellatus]